MAGQGGVRDDGRAVERVEVGVGGASCLACRQHAVGEPSQVLEQHQAHDARPRPQLAERQRRERLEGVEEGEHVRPVEPAVGVADERARQRLDAGQAAVALAHDRQAPVEAPRQVAPQGPHFGIDEVVVVENPVAGRTDVLVAARVGRQPAVRLVEAAHVVGKARERAAPRDGAARPASASASVRARSCRRATSRSSSRSGGSGAARRAKGIQLGTMPDGCKGGAREAPPSWREGCSEPGGTHSRSAFQGSEALRMGNSDATLRHGGDDSDAYVTFDARSVILDLPDDGRVADSAAGARRARRARRRRSGR